ncbi:MAG: hypothetical protein ACT4P6_17365 [Gemmatimonadaceae bacterium]
MRRCLVDAMVLIDGVRYGFLPQLIQGHAIAVAETAYAEVKYFRDDTRNRHSIDLGPFVRDGKLGVISATVDEMTALLRRLSRRSLGAGELEALALVLARGHRFCTADRVARRAMHEIELGSLWVSLEDLLGSLVPPIQMPDAKYGRA